MWGKALAAGWGEDIYRKIQRLAKTDGSEAELNASIRRREKGKDSRQGVSA